jgi:cytochrome c peroxidase
VPEAEQRSGPLRDGRLTLRQPQSSRFSNMRPRQLAAAACRGGALIGSLALLLCAGVSFSGNAPLDRPSVQAAFRRPAEIPFPEDNAYSKVKSRLGQLLFFDPILSGSRSRSCSSCHSPALSWGDGLPRAVGEKQEAMTLRAPTLLDVAWMPRLGWDGHFRDLESVAFGPILSSGNMNLSEGALVERLSAIPGYVAAFNAAFGEGDINRRKIELALATFERTIVSTEAPFDRWIGGDESAISDAAKRGFDLFNGKGHCASCHSGWSFTDFSFHDIGTAKGDDIGRGRLFPNSVKLRYAFKTPTLRDVARRGPYMHDGSVATLNAVIDLYNRGGIDRPSRSDRIFPLKLADSEKSDLIAFLNTLSGAPEPVSVPVLPR